MNRIWRALPVLALAMAAAGCGYHVGDKAVLIPKDVKSIAIPEFSNGTVHYRVATALTEDVIREFHSRTKYTIVADAKQADAVLNGSVVNLAVLGGTTTDPVTGRATSSQLILTVSFTLTNRHTGKPIYQRTGYEFREAYEITTDLTKYFDESGPAVMRVSQDAAQGIVSSILEAF